MRGLIEKLASEREELAASTRRDLHRIPEKSSQETRTTAYILEFLAKRGVTAEIASSGTGVLAFLGGGPRQILLRADIDALPVTEETGLNHASETPGMMHACGHDAHAAILLAVADALSSGAFPLDCSVALLFQPAEEGLGGMRTLLNQGLLDRVKPDAAFALHVWPGLSADSVALVSGPAMAGVNYVKATFTGPGGHGAYPHLTADTVAAAAAFVSAALNVTGRRTDPLSSRVLTFGAIHGGSAPNIIPGRVEVEGTMRWYAPEVGQELAEALEDTAKAVSTMHGAGYELIVDEGYVPVVNDPSSVEKLRRALNEILGPEKVLPGVLSMGAEDMGFLLEKVPGVYVHLGAGASGPGAAQLHSCSFYPEDACLVTGIKTLLTALWAFGSR